MAGGQTYAQLSGKSLADPTNTKLVDEVQVVFRGETLRGLLLNADAFDTMGNVASIGAIVSYIGAALMAVLAFLGSAHARGVQEAPAEPTGTAPAIETIND